MQILAKCALKICIYQLLFVILQSNLKQCKFIKNDIHYGAII